MSRGFRAVTVVTIAALPLLLAGLAQADRKATSKERAQLAKVLEVPPRCAKARISTETPKPKWGSVSFNFKGKDCEPFASDGIVVAKKSEGRWHFVIAGSSFDCPSLYKKVPKSVAVDLGITCHQL